MIENQFGHLPPLKLVLRIGFDDLLLQCIHGGIAIPFFLVGGVESGAQTVGVVSLNFAEHLLVERDRNHFALLYPERFV